MAQQLPQMVTSLKGKQFRSDSTQGLAVMQGAEWKAKNLPQQPFKKESSALAPMSPQKTGLATVGEATPMSPMEGVMAIFQSMADSLESIKESAMSLVDAAGPSRADALEASNIEGPPPEEGPSDEKPGFLKRMRNKVKMPSLKKMGLIAIMTGVILFAEKIKPVVAIVLKGFKFVYDLLKNSLVGVFNYVKEFFADPVGTLKKSLAAVLDGLASLGAWVWDKGIKPVWDWITGLFDSGAGATIKEKFLAVAGVFTSLGSWIWKNAISPVWNWIKGLFGFGETDKTQAGDDTGGEGGLGSWIWTNAISPVWNWIKGLFGFGTTDKTQAGDDTGGEGGLGSWIWTNAISPIWNWIKGLFSNPVDALIVLAKTIFGVYASIGKFLWGKVISPIWTWIKGLFGFGKDDETEEGEDSPEKSGGLGSWLWSKTIGPIWNWIKGLFSWGDDDLKEAEGEETGWSVSSLITGVFTSIKEWFGKLFKWDSTSDIITSLVNVITFVPNLIKDLITGATEWLLGLFGFDDAAKKVANATDWTFGSLITGAFTAVKDWFLGIFGWGKEDETKEGEDDLKKGGLGTWIWDNTISPIWNMITGFFSNPLGTIADLIKNIFGAYVSIGKWIWGMTIGPAWTWIKGIFGFGEDEETESTKEKFSMTSLLVKAAEGAWAWLSGLFSFSDETKAKLGKEFGQIKLFAKAIGSGAWAAIKNLFGSPIEAFKTAFAETLASGTAADIPASIDEANEALESGGAPALKGLAGILDATAASAMYLQAMALKTGAAAMADGGGVTIIDSSSNTVSNSNSSNDTYRQADLDTNHKESSGSWYSNIDWTPWN